jgi:ribosomal protein S18 acetylase RimI-like enzyme
MTYFIGFRPVSEDDLEFLYRVYASTREEELAVVDWTPEQKEAFLRMQFNLQHKSYMENCPNQDFSIIFYEGKPAGRLYLSRTSKEIRIVDIALLPEFRRKSIGTTILKDILREGAEKGLPVSIHVEHFNPALRLYERLGFKQVHDQGVYYLMEWSPEREESRGEPKGQS